MTAFVAGLASVLAGIIPMAAGHASTTGGTKTMLTSYEQALSKYLVKLKWGACPASVVIFCFGLTV